MTLDAGAIQELVAQADAYKVNYVGIDLTLDGFAVAADERLRGKPLPRRSKRSAPPRNGP